MFTGLVEAVGRIVAVETVAAARRIVVDPGNAKLDEVRVGDSIAVNGCCLTVVTLPPGRIAFDVSAETLACTAGLDAPGPVNLEQSLRLGDRLGGHLVTGHVDGVGTVLACEPAGGDDGGSRRLVVEAPAALARFIAAKGSIAVAGVSLTVNRVQGARFEVNLIPHTLQATTLAGLGPDDRVNLEIDLVARYVARLREADGADAVPRATGEP